MRTYSYNAALENEPWLNKKKSVIDVAMARVKKGDALLGHKAQANEVDSPDAVKCNIWVFST